MVYVCQGEAVRRKSALAKPNVTDSGQPVQIYMREASLSSESNDCILTGAQGATTVASLHRAGFRFPIFAFSATYTLIDAIV